jgi:hypothetical protein
MTATIATTTRTTAFLLGAILSAAASLYAIVLILVVAGDQMVVGPVTQQVSFAPWWAMFGNSDWVLVLGFLFASLAFAWLAWYFCRRAFSRGRVASQPFRL